jgi:hypothetical protein
MLGPTFPIDPEPFARFGISFGRGFFIEAMEFPRYSGHQCRIALRA